MSNKQVIAIFIIGVGLLLGAFWAGLYVVKQDSSGAATTNRAVNQNSRNASSANQNSAGQASVNTNTQQASLPPGDARYIVQVGASFGTADKANELTTQLRHKYPSAHTQNPTGTDTLFRVRIGPYNSREDAQQVANELASQGFKGVMIFPWSGN
jgi:cell division septation protein DedD